MVLIHRPISSGQCTVRRHAYERAGSTYRTRRRLSLHLTSSMPGQLHRDMIAPVRLRICRNYNTRATPHHTRDQIWYVGRAAPRHAHVAGITQGRADNSAGRPATAVKGTVHCRYKVVSPAHHLRRCASRGVTSGKDDEEFFFTSAASASRSGLASVRHFRLSTYSRGSPIMSPCDIMLMKKYASCFFGNDLVPRLNSRRMVALEPVGGRSAAAL
jgi:hypothetical protein